MVSTRSHPTTFPPPTPRHLAAGTWTHHPPPLTLLWLLVSLPLVCWDTAYVLLRPHSMAPRGALHAPLFLPYALYGRVDHMYGAEAWEARNGFTGAQAGLNVVESVGYAAYLWVVWRCGEGGVVGGGWGGVACLVGFAVSVMTVSKTVLYWCNEFFSGFDNIGHNDALSLLFLWIIPNGLWLVFPSYMVYEFARDILHGLSIASGDRSSKPARAATPTKDE